MTRYISDQNKVVCIFESGTYAASGTSVPRWIGQVQEFSVDDNENPIETRYVGALKRTLDSFDDGPYDVTGTLTYNPQDVMLIAHAIGSVSQSTAAGHSTYKAAEVNTDVLQNPFTSGTTTANTPFSVTFEDSKQAPGTGKNFIRTIYGAVVNTATINASQGEKVSVDIDWVAQATRFSSGTTTTTVADTTKAYVWGDCSLQLSGTTIDTAKEVTIEINNNIEPPHYLNGSREIGNPFPGNKDYSLSVTADFESDTAKNFYDGIYKGGSSFNAVFDMNADITATGSKHAIITMSGCRIATMDIPATTEGANEVTMEIKPKNMTLVSYDGSGTTGSYNPW